ncbi:restriction endonuclease subunit S [Agrobacterium tumefaciens]|uniref:restriction endonuclease subunit S n=1 Tax=Agrobacterium tumefaciens TaxID=358 RepID=UPI001EED3D42|nr:restriction endonuclease subunit S [Agrobacterium tumefaciens]WCK74176.1 restriction endonuclease subunit S [Agrobacterium tumefaciens]
MFGADCELGDIVEFVNGGAWSQSAYSAGGVPVVRVTNIRGDHIDLSDCKHLPFELRQKYQKHLLRTGDLVIATVGSHPTQPNSVVGRPAVVSDRIDGCLLNQNAVLLRSKSNRLDQRWLGYLGKSDRFRSYIIECARGSANQVRMSIALLKKMPVRLPALETQHRIASILGAYDDLIEVNRRRIVVLEEMARGLFEEWFVRLRFPGFEAVSIQDTQNGPLPEGWNQVAFGSLLQHSVGGLWGEATATNADDQRVSVVRGTDFPKLLVGNYAGVPDRFVSDRELASRVLAAGDLVLEASGGSKDQPVGRVLYVTASLIERLRPPVAPASFCRLLRPLSKAGNGLYLYGLLQAMYKDGRIEKFQKQSTGLRNLSMKHLAAETVTVPEDKLLASFESATKPWLEAASLHRHESRALGASRDLLLRRLMSGELSGAEVERELEEAA